MHLRLRRSVAGVALVAATFVVGAAPARAQTESQINNITLGSSWAYIGPTSFVTAALPVAFRWVDAAGKDTSIAGHSCSDFTQLDAPVAFAAGSTSYKSLFSRPVGTCFALRGRVATWESAMANPHDGRVRR